ncbi:MAG: acyl-CoA desaturase, partial [Planctomycetia bacterium]
MSSAPTASPIDREDEFAFGRSAIHDPLVEDACDAGVCDIDEEVEGRAGRQSVEPRIEDGRLDWSPLDWPVVLWIGGVHLAALAAPFFFPWSGFAICMVLYYITGSLGVCLGYHRLLTHGSFACTRAVKLFFAFMGGISGEGSALHWVSNHRKHHAFSDQEGDPHTPHD